MKKVAIIVAVSSVLLTACGKEPISFEGKYLITEGEECTPDTKSRNKDMVFLEVIAQGKGDEKSYMAKVPAAAAWGWPTNSTNSAQPTEHDELNFTFFKEGEAGLFSGKPSVDMSLTMKPHESKKDHLWLSKWDTTISQHGVVKQMSPIDEMRKLKDKSGTPEFQVSLKGICLKKLST